MNSSGLLQENILICPACRSKLVAQPESLTCTNPACAQKYSIIDGIPVMLPGDTEKIKQDILASKGEQNMFEKKFLGIPIFKIDYTVKKWLYKCLRIKLPKLEDQRDYWLNRGNVYRKEFIEKGYESLEIFFQNLVIRELKEVKFSSIFEAGCGFGWNIRRFKREFPDARVGGLDFSHTQLLNGKEVYLKESRFELTEGDATRMPFVNNAYDVGFSLGVFMNINPKKIGNAIDEMIRVCGKYIIHLEYDEHHASPDLAERRAFKTNIVSHDYKKMYEAKGLKIKRFLTAKDFGAEYEQFMKDRSSGVQRWESWEGASKYILIVAEK